MDQRCTWCDRILPSPNEEFCSEACESAQNEHVRDLYDEGRGDAGDEEV